MKEEKSLLPYPSTRPGAISGASHKSHQAWPLPFWKKNVKFFKVEIVHVQSKWDIYSFPTELMTNPMTCSVIRLRTHDHPSERVRAHPLSHPKNWTKIVSKFREKWIGGKQPTFPREISLQGTRTEFLPKFNNSLSVGKEWNTFCCSECGRNITCFGILS